MSRQHKELGTEHLATLWGKILATEVNVESGFNQVTGFFANKANKKSCDLALLNVFLEFFNKHKEQAGKFFPDIAIHGFEGFCLKVITSYLSENINTRSEIETLLKFFPTAEVRDKLVIHEVKKHTINADGWSKVSKLLPMISNETWCCEAMLRFSRLPGEEFGIGFLQECVAMLSDDRNKSNLIMQWSESGHSFDLQSINGIAYFRQIFSTLSDQSVRSNLASQILMAEKAEDKRAQNLMGMIQSDIFSDQDFIEIKRKIGFADKNPFALIRVAQLSTAAEVHVVSDNEVASFPTAIEVINHHDKEVLPEQKVRPKSNIKPISSVNHGVVNPSAGWEIKFFIKNYSSR